MSVHWPLAQLVVQAPRACAPAIAASARATRARDEVRGRGSAVIEDASERDLEAAEVVRAPDVAGGADGGAEEGEAKCDMRGGRVEAELGAPGEGGLGGGAAAEVELAGGEADARGDEEGDLPRANAEGDLGADEGCELMERWGGVAS